MTIFLYAMGCILAALYADELKDDLEYPKLFVAFWPLAMALEAWLGLVELWRRRRAKKVLE